MKRSLQKKTDSHILAHLYEHIYYIYVDSLLREQGLYPIIDYDMEAFTEDGTIQIEVEAYSGIDIDQHFLHADKHCLDNLDIIDVAIAQLAAEHQHSIAITDHESLMVQLQIINTAAWNDEITIELDDSSIAYDTEIDTQTVTLTFDYEGVDQHLRPLYRLIAGTLMNTAASDIADTYGGFVNSETFQTDNDRNLAAHVIVPEQIETEEIEALISETKKEMIEHEAFERLVSQLRSIETMAYSPSVEATKADTGITMDADKWRHLVTDENLSKAVAKLHWRVV